MVLDSGDLDGVRRSSALMRKECDLTSLSKQSTFCTRWGNKTVLAQVAIERERQERMGTNLKPWAQRIGEGCGLQIKHLYTPGDRRPGKVKNQNLKHLRIFSLRMEITLFAQGS